MSTPCPCGRAASYEECCGRLHRGEAPAPTAEALMRSRYAAFAVGDEDYLRGTWDPATCPRRIGARDGTRWSGLEILGRSGGGLLESTGTVEFRAHHRHGVVHENSRFRREGGRWLYVGPA